MSLGDRLRTAATPDAALDIDDDVADVHRRANRIRRRRTGVFASVVILVAVAAVATLWPSGRDEATVDTADTATAWYLPASVPDGYRLAWVDPPTDRPNTGITIDPWASDYAYGYHSSVAELDTRIILNAALDDPAAIASELDDDGTPETIDGRPAIRWRSDGSTVRLLIELDGAVAHIFVHPRGTTIPDPPPLPSQDVVDRYATSITRVGQAEWETALASSGADVADRYGPLEGNVVLEGGGWQVLDGTFRPPFSARHRAIWARIGQHPASSISGPPDQDFWSGDILQAEGVRLAWGLAPASSRTVRVRIDGLVFTGDTVATAGWRVWALDISRTGSAGGSVEFLDASGRVIGDGPLTDPSEPPEVPAISDDGDPKAQAMEMVRRLDCDSTDDGMQYVPPDELQPLAALACMIGDAHINVTVYASEEDVHSALDALAPYCGFRAVGPNWIVVTNTLETAQRSAAALGGEAFTLPGCTDE